MPEQNCQSIGVHRFEQLIVKGATGGPSVHEIPADAVLQAPLRHPQFDWFAGLGLRWYAAPIKHLDLEEADDRRCPADWTWIVPAAACHRATSH